MAGEILCFIHLMSCYNSRAFLYRCDFVKKSPYFAPRATSSPNVGSSSIKRRGSGSKAMAMSNLWRIPRDSSPARLFRTLSNRASSLKPLCAHPVFCRKHPLTCRSTPDYRVQSASSRLNGRHLILHPTFSKAFFRFWIISAPPTVILPQVGIRRPARSFDDRGFA